MMRKWMVRLLLAVIVFAVIWTMTVLHWRSTARMPSTSEVTLWFGVAPLVFLTSLWLLSTVARTAVQRLAAAPVPGEPDTRATPPTSAEKENTEQQWQLALLGSALRMPHGADAGDLHLAFSENTARPALDPEFANQAGFPVVTGRVADVSVDDTEDALFAWQQQQALDPISWNPEQLRALALGAQVMQSLIEQAQLLVAAGRQVPPPAQEQECMPMLELIVLLPSDWSEIHRRRATSWLANLALSAGWPGAQLMISPIVQATPTALGAADRFLLQTQRQGTRTIGLLLACDSAIGEASIAEWEAGGRLFDGKDNRREVPGEGAAGLLLASRASAATLASEAAAVMHRVTQARHENAFAAGRAVPPGLLAELTAGALRAAQAQGDEIGSLVADCDHRASHVAELMQAGYAVLPALDMSRDYIRIGDGCGNAGIAASVAAIAVARHAASERGKPVVCVSNQHALERAVAVIRPLAAESDT